MLSSSEKVIVWQLRLAIAAVFVAVGAGLVGALHYIEPVSVNLNAWGIQLTQLRPIHTTFAHFWIFSACVAVIYRYIHDRHGGFNKGELLRFKFHLACWLAASAGVLITLALGITSGREYLGFHPIFSAILLAGWIAFAWTWFARTARDFWSQPVYVYMWSVGILYFIYTFVEGHAYLLPSIAEQPIVDLQIQWKSCGTLVGSFNFLMYGSLMYIGEKMSGDRNYARSRLAFALFAVGTLNSFTNYAHHTYHLPQMELIKWVSFSVSMLEIVILWRIIVDIVGLVQKRRLGGEFDTATSFLVSSKWWTSALLPISILISVPPLNAFIHGTHVVLGHAMGAELGINTMVLLGAFAYLMKELYPRDPKVHAMLDGRGWKAHIILLNVSMALLIAWLTISGLVHGLYRYEGLEAPVWIVKGRHMMVLAGTGMAVALLGIMFRWARLLVGIEARRAEPETGGT